MTWKKKELTWKDVTGIDEDPHERSYDKIITHTSRDGLLNVRSFCPFHGDPQCDGATDVLDVVNAVNVAFRGAAATTDPLCPYEQTDVSCDGVTNVIDVVKFVNVAFRGGDAGVEFCEGCE